MRFIIKNNDDTFYSMTDGDKFVYLMNKTLQVREPIY